MVLTDAQGLDAVARRFGGNAWRVDPSTHAHPTHRTVMILREDGSGAHLLGRVQVHLEDVRP